MSDNIIAITDGQRIVGYIRPLGEDWCGYMTKDDALNRRYPVGLGTKDDATAGIARILAEIRAEQAFERRYA
jgi:hypothetical protein